MRRPTPGLSEEEVRLVLDRFLGDWALGEAEARAALQAAQGGKLDPATLAPLRRLFHNVSGLLPSLGWRELGFIAHQAEQLCAAAPGQPGLLATLGRSLEEVCGLVQEAGGARAAEPARSEPAPAEKSATVGEEELSGQCVLVVDDDQASAELVSGCLGKRGYRVVTCTQPDQALAVLEREQPALTILDVMMPSVDGFELCRRIRARTAQKYMPILFLSAAGAVEERITGLTVGGDDFLAKPFSPEELFARVHGHLQRVATLREMSIRDALTRTFNRGYFDERLAQEAARSERYGNSFALAMLDIDFFKRVNDEHGHQAGDAVLVQTAQVLSAQFRKSDVVSRYGGEEFAVILLGASLERAAATVSRALGTLARTPFTLAMPEQPRLNLTLTLSAGVAGYTPGEAHQLLLSRADRALYAAKASGRNRVVVREAPGPGEEKQQP